MLLAKIPCIKLAIESIKSLFIKFTSQFIFESDKNKQTSNNNNKRGIYINLIKFKFQIEDKDFEDKLKDMTTLLTKLN